jgi:mRNA-degrading endonuclease RelE of RelBE toxin-antitoxin system
MWADVRAIDQQTAMRILTALHRYAETGQGDVKALEADLAGLQRLRVGDYRVLFDQTAYAINVHRVKHRSEAYR